MAPSRRDSRQPTPVKQESDIQDATFLPLPNTIASIVHLHQAPAQIPSPSITTQPKKGGSKPGQHRNKFTLEKGKETADTRRAGACDECKRKKARCHPSHRNPPVEAPIQASTLGRQQNAVPRTPVHSYSMDEYLTNPTDARPLIESFKLIPNPTDTRVGFGNADASISNVSIAPAYRIRKSSNAHSTNRLGIKVHSYPRSDLPGQGTPHRLAARGNDIRQRPRNSTRSHNQQPRPTRKEQGDNHQPGNQTLQLPSAQVASRSLPPASTSAAYNTASGFVSPNSFLRKPTPPPHDTLYGSYPVQFNYMGGASMTANLPSMNDSNNLNPTASSHGFIPPGYKLSPFTPPSSQVQGHYQDYGTQPTANNQGTMNHNNNAFEQNAVISNNTPHHQAFNNEVQAYVPEFVLPSLHDTDTIDPQSYLPSQHDFDMINGRYDDMIDNDLSEPVMNSSFNDQPPVPDMGYNENNTNNAYDTNNTNNLRAETMPSSDSHNEPSNPYDYQISPVLEPADWEFPLPNDFSNEQPFHDLVPSTNMTYDETYFPSFRTSEDLLRFEERPSLPIRSGDTGGMMENMGNFDLNPIYDSFDEETWRR